MLVSLFAFINISLNIDLEKFVLSYVFSYNPALLLIMLLYYHFYYILNSIYNCIVNNYYYCI